MGPFAHATYGTQTRQIGSWYEAESYFVVHTQPWFTRGGAFSGGIGSGMFYVENVYGPYPESHTYRIVLSI